MADHIDGPRTIGDPSIDLTDIFAFHSPENPSRTVLIAPVHPGAGEVAFFSNAANFSFALKRIKQTGLGKNAGFEPIGNEIRFNFVFELLEPGTQPQAPAAAQRGTFTLPSGEVLPVTVGDEKGSTSKDRSVRVFAGVRSDPFFIAWSLSTLEPVPNYAQNDNILALVIELEIDKFLPLKDGTLFGVIAETSPRRRGPTTLEGPRYDWVGRPEQANFILFGLPNSVDLRDLWNQLEPFAPIPSDVKPVFRQRLAESFRYWDNRDSKTDWDNEAIESHINVRIDDFLLFDTAKPITDQSHLEIEKSTIAGKPYQTGGGRTIDANVIDILVTYLVNRDQGKFYQSPATQATQRGLKIFPYLAPPNKELLSLVQEIHLQTSTSNLWSLIGRFAAPWHPLAASIQTRGNNGPGQLRIIETVEGKDIIERLDSIDPKKRILKYSLVSGIAALPLNGVIEVTPSDGGSKLKWTIQYRPSGQGDVLVHFIITQWMEVGVKALKTRYGVKQ
jgi:hypothetical protein